MTVKELLEMVDSATFVVLYNWCGVSPSYYVRYSDNAYHPGEMLKKVPSGYLDDEVNCVGVEGHRLIISAGKPSCK